MATLCTRRPASGTLLLLAAVVLSLAVMALLPQASASDNGLGLLPPLGWNTWCTQGQCGRDYCDEDEIKSIAEALISSGLKDLGFNYVNLDDCWASLRDEKTGEITADPQRFPSGMKHLADWLHARGLKFGLYTDAGLFTCSSGERPYQIPGSYGHYEQDAKTYASWGMDYVKMDWCNTLINGTQLVPEIQYEEMSRALNSTGRAIFFETCEWGVDDPWRWMRQFANSWRATEDHHDEWENTKRVIEDVANLHFYGGPGGWNYMDFLMTGGEGCPSNAAGQRCPGMTDTEYRTEFTMWVIAASPLIVATDIRNMSAIQKEILFNKDLLRVHQDKLGRAGGRLTFVACGPNNLTCEIWGRPLFDGSWALALYNKNDIPAKITVSFKDVLGWQYVPVSVKDLWAHRDLGHYEDSFTSAVPAHGTVALQVSF